MIRRVLAAIDGSRSAPGVFRAALEIADRFDAALHLFRAIPIPPEFPPAAHTRGGDPLPSYLMETALAELSAFAATTERAHVEPPVIAVGKPWRAILEAAERLDVDLIVLGSHGYDAIDRMLGTTAGSVANRAHRNVLIVHEH